MGHENYTQEISGVMKNDNFDFMGHEYTIKYASCRAMKPYTMYIDFMGHDSSKRSVPWIESHPEI